MVLDGRARDHFAIKLDTQRCRRDRDLVFVQCYACVDLKTLAACLKYDRLGLIVLELLFGYFNNDPVTARPGQRDTHADLIFHGLIAEHGRRYTRKE